MYKLIIIVLMLIYNISAEALLTVGGDNACDYLSLQQAINQSADGEEIRISGSALFENIVINDRSVKLVGGYDNCNKAELNISNGLLAAVDGQDMGSVITITGQQTHSNVLLENLFIGNGLETGNGRAGGVAIYLADADITLNNTRVAFNYSEQFGGGVGVYLGNVNLTLNNSHINDNQTASNGAGLHCSGVNSQVSILGSSEIYNNRAIDGDSLGGGVYLTNFCEADFFAPVKIHNNKVRNYFTDGGVNTGGGAFAVVNRAQLDIHPYYWCVPLGGCLFTNAPVVISGNDAVKGSVAYVKDAKVNFTNVKIINNKKSNPDHWKVSSLIWAQSSGIETSFSSRSKNPKECNDPDGCHLYKANEAQKFVVAGVDTIVNIEGANLSNNVMRSFLASNGEVTVGNSFITDNSFLGLSQGFDLQTTGQLYFTNNTMANNVFESLDDAYNLFSGGAQSYVQVYGSIINENTNVSIASESKLGNYYFRCLLVHDQNSIPGVNNNIKEADPLFMDSDNGDYRLKGGSLAIDFCQDYLPSYTYSTDFGGELRGWDDPAVNNYAGPYDVGADESYQNDIIFDDSFE
ncbi:MAG: hypothetical protein KDI92_09145 [Xanthomonadales bacterium]|nr:hypothetical protein [Xanthomonadales bacterium]